MILAVRKYLNIELKSIVWTRCSQLDLELLPKIREFLNLSTPKLLSKNICINGWSRWFHLSPKRETDGLSHISIFQNKHAWISFGMMGAEMGCFLKWCSNRVSGPFLYYMSCCWSGQVKKKKVVQSSGPIYSKLWIWSSMHWHQLRRHTAGRFQCKTVRGCNGMCIDQGSSKLSLCLYPWAHHIHSYSTCDTAVLCTETWNRYWGAASLMQPDLCQLIIWLWFRNNWQGPTHHISLSKACYGYYDLRQRAILHHLVLQGLA